MVTHFEEGQIGIRQGLEKHLFPGGAAIVFTGSKGEMGVEQN
jgi:hypothetical protein